MYIKRVEGMGIPETLRSDICYSFHTPNLTGFKMNDIRLEELAETIFERMSESFKDLTPSEEQIVYDCACDEAIKQTS